MKRFYFLSVVAMLFSANAYAEYDKWNGVVFSGYRTTTSSDTKEVDRSKLYYSKVGIRMENNSNDSVVASVVNYKKEKCYLLNVTKKTYVEGDVKAGECTISNAKDFRDEVVNFKEIFIPKLCHGFDSMVQVDKGKVDGRSAYQWNCKDKAGNITSQWFNRALDMVVRIKKPTGTDIQLSGVKLSRTTDESLLNPPADYVALK